MPRKSKRFPRDLAARLREALADTPAVLIHGPRQSGKTTLTRTVGEPRGYRYVSFDDEAVQDAAKRDPIGFVEGLPRRTILDEVQRVPEIFTSLKAAIDHCARGCSRRMPMRPASESARCGTSRTLAEPVRMNRPAVRHDAPFLHTTDLTNFMREFQGWTEERRRALMADLMNVIHDAGRIAAVGAVMAVDDFSSLKPKQRARLRDPFFPLFQEVIDGASLEAYVEPPTAKVRMVYSQQDEFAGSARQLFDVRRGRNPRIGDLQFADLRTVPGLQAADLLSFEFARYYRNQRTRPELAMRRPLRQILRQQRILNIHYLKTVPKWYLRLQPSPCIVYVLASIGLTALVAVPAYFDMTWFTWANRAPRLPQEDEEQIRELERHERRRRRL